jgi:hypothetical protein
MTNIKNNDTLNRMKSLMNYGLQTESKNTPYSSVEYQRVGADGNTYGIVREGTKYYIKSAGCRKNPLNEDFAYIGGFRNRKENEYSSFANAQKNFDLKMMAIKESVGKRNFNVESWDLDKKENVVIEASEKMKKEILREQQIMRNTIAINEKKAVCCDEVPPMKDNIKKEEPTTGESFGKEVSDGLAKGSDICPECGKKGGNCVCGKDTDYKGSKKTTNESSEVLGWNRKSDDYMDKSHGTEIGDSAPFDDATAHNIDEPATPVTKTGEMKNGVVENHGTAMHPTQDQNKPEPGNGEGPSDDNNKPFDAEKGRQIDEAIDDFEESDVEGEDFGDKEPADDLGGEEPTEDFGDEEPADDLGGEEPTDDLGGEEEEGDDMFEDDLESRMDALEDMIVAIANKLGVNTPAVDESDYEDEDLFGDEDEDGDDYELDLDDEEDEEPEVYESRGFKKAMLKEDGMTRFTDNGRVPQGNMNKLDDFGKHPAYQKKVMTLPTKDHQEFPGYYDMNDDSVKNDTPYGENIGDGAPFEIDPESIDNAIAEAINRFKKKL